MKSLVTALFATFSIALIGGASAEGDAAKGEKFFKKCKACHAVGENAKNKVGPQLNDLFGRTAGTVEDYKYSKAMSARGEEGLVWTDETLSEYLRAPRKYVKGTKMAYAGVKKEDDLENLLAYLKQFSEGEQSAAPADTDSAMAETQEEAAPEGPPDLSEATLTDASVIAAGGEIWGSQCRHCHGKNAYPGKAPKLKPRKYKPEFVFDRVTNGFRKMPGWKEVYTQDERVAIVAYIKSKKFSP